MFTLLSGRFVHEAGTKNEQLGLAMSNSAESLAEAWPQAPASLVRLVDRALAYDRADRWQSARDLLGELDLVTSELRDGGASGASTSSSRARLTSSVGGGDDRRRQQRRGAPRRFLASPKADGPLACSGGRRVDVRRRDVGRSG